MNAVISLPENLPNVAAARLPATYEAAQKAIAECSRVDECKSWADKAAALASYARQANDDSLRVMAVRIQARAERRCGELLKQIPRGDELTRFGRAGEAHPPVTRAQAATNAGLSEHRRKTAMRIATMPAEEFQRQVEGPSPPSITQLAQCGKGSRHSSEIGEPDQEKLACQARDALERFARFCDSHDPAEVAQLFAGNECAGLRGYVAAIDRWLDRFVAHLAR
jgi:hypothetical protein